MLSKDLRQSREADVERVRAQCAFLQKFMDIFQQSDLAKLALILECEAMRIGENKEHSRMFRRLLLMLEIPERAGHAEMQAQPELITGAHEQMLAVPVTVFEAASFQSTYQLTRGNAFQNISVSHIDADDPLVQRCGIQIPSECFDIGQLWHQHLGELLNVSLQWQRIIVFGVLRALPSKLKRLRARRAHWVRRLASLLRLFAS